MDGNETSGGGRGRLSERAVVAAAVALAIGSLLLTRAPAATAATPIVQVHSGPGGVVVDSPTVTATGTGHVQGTPDTLTVNMNVTVTAAHASDALDQCGSKAATLLQTLVAAGAGAKDIATDSLSIQPQYRNGDYRSITGYTVSENVTVTLHDLGKAGSIIDSAARSIGDAVRINGMSLSISDTSALLAAARAEAVSDARAKAGAMAAGAGVALGTVRSIGETSAYTPQYFATDRAAGADAVLPISPGQQQLTVNVTVVYTLAT